VSGSTLGCVTATEQPAPSRAGGVALDARDLTRCRRRIHLDHDPDAVGLPQALPDPAFAQRREDAARHRAEIAAVIRRETGCFVVPADADAERATAAAVAEGAALIWGALLPAARGTRRAPVELLVRVPGAARGGQQRAPDQRRALGDRRGRGPLGIGIGRDHEAPGLAPDRKSVV